MPPRTSYVTLGKLTNLFVPQFSHLQNGVIKCALQKVMVRINVVRWLIVRERKARVKEGLSIPRWQVPGHQGTQEGLLL